MPTIVPPVIFNFFVARTIDDLWYSEVHKHLVPISAQFAIATYHVLAMVVTLPLVIITNRQALSYLEERLAKYMLNAAAEP